jgi:hypothetical protein
MPVQAVVVVLAGSIGISQPALWQWWLDAAAGATVMLVHQDPELPRILPARPGLVTYVSTTESFHVNAWCLPRLARLTLVMLQEARKLFPDAAIIYVTSGDSIPACTAAEFHEAPVRTVMRILGILRTAPSADGYLQLACSRFINGQLDLESLKNFMRFLFVSQWCCVVKEDADAILALASAALGPGNAVDQLSSVWTKEALEQEDVNRGLVCPDEFFLSTLLACSKKGIEHVKHANQKNTTAAFYPFKEITPHPLAWDAIKKWCVTELRFTTSATLEKKGTAAKGGPGVAIDVYGAFFLTVFQRRALNDCANLVFLRKVRVREPLEPKALFDPVEETLATCRHLDVKQILKQSSWLKKHMQWLCGPCDELRPKFEQQNEIAITAMSKRYFRRKDTALAELMTASRPLAGRERPRSRSAIINYQKLLTESEGK